jgi:hypothetical protein
VADTIREFLVGLGFSVNESQQRNFVGALEGATLRAKLLGDAIEAMARTVVNKVGEVATQFEALFYQSSRVGASAQSIRAFEFAISNLGGTIEGAKSSLEDFSKFLRETPGSTAAIANLLKIPLEDAKDSAKFLLEANERLSHLSPALQAKYRETFHLGDYNTSIAAQNAKAEQYYNEQLKRDSAAGIDQGAMKRASEFERAWRGVWARIGTMADGGESKLFTGLTKPMKDFNDWLDQHQAQLNNSIGKISKSLGDLAEQWTIDLGKIILGDDQVKGLDDTTDAITNFLDSLKPLVRELKDFNEASKNWWFVKAMNSVSGGTAVPALPSGPGFVAAHGPGVDASGVRKWWGEHAPSWLGGDAAALSVSGVDDAKAIKQEGVPVGTGNPLAVNLVKVDPSVKNGDGGGGILGSIGGAVSGAVHAVRHALGLGGASPGIRARAVGGTPTGNEAALAKQAYTYWRGQGLSHDAALAVIGNERGENALGANGGFGDGGTAVGQFQWHADRRADIIRGAGIDPLSANFMDQQRAARWEMEHGSGGGHVWEALKNAKSREEAVWIMVHGFERSANQRSDAAIRLGYADRYAKVVTDGGGTAMAAPAPAPTGSLRPVPKIGGIAPLSWDTASPVWDQFNRSLPVGSAGNTDASKNVTSTVTNNITVSGSDPQSTAAMVGLHLDRTSNDISRNLQGAFQ